jgi:hypothetical protein
MNTDMLRFTRIINRLIFLTTRDEYGSSRSKGIGTYSQLVEELNNEGISAANGKWTENSLKLHISRVKNRYPIDELISECDIELIDRSNWEYVSGVQREEVIKKRRHKVKKKEDKVTKSYPLVTYEPIAGEVWKEHEISDVLANEKNTIKKLKDDKTSRH